MKREDQCRWTSSQAMGGLPSVKAFLRATPPETAIHHQSFLSAGARTNSFEQVISTVCWWKRGDNVRSGKHLVYFSLEESGSGAGGADAEWCWEVQTILLTLSSVRSLPNSLWLYWVPFLPPEDLIQYLSTDISLFCSDKCQSVRDAPILQFWPIIIFMWWLMIHYCSKVYFLFFCFPF